MTIWQLKCLKLIHVKKKVCLRFKLFKNLASAQKQSTDALTQENKKAELPISKSLLLYCYWDNNFSLLSFFYQKGCFWYTTGKVNTNIEFCIFELA